MRNAHTAGQVRAAEAAAMSTLPDGALMQRAATGLACAVLEFLGQAYGRRVLLLVGSGDNGGDALFAGAQLARRGAQVSAVLLSDKAHQPGLAALRASGGRVVPELPAALPDVVLDGIVGLGSSGSLRPAAAAAVAALERSPFVAVDVPSGVDVDTGKIDGPHVKATLTVTFGTHKIAHLVDPAAFACGVIHLVDLGLDLPDAMVSSLQLRDAASRVPVPAPNAHKYSRGVVGVRAGSRDYPGAGVLCVSGASCGLVGMVRYVGEAAPLVHQQHPEVVVGQGRVQAWVVGSGGGADAATALSAACEDRVPLVVDADALSHVDAPLGVPTLLTPHAGELARMLDRSREEVEREQLRSAREAATRFGAVVLLKGRHTLVAAPDGRVRVTTVGPPWLATAGSGDVLAGLCGALLAAGLDPFEAGALGSWLHGAAAEHASAGGPITAVDVAGAVPTVCRMSVASCHR